MQVSSAMQAEAQAEAQVQVFHCAVLFRSCLCPSCLFLLNEFPFHTPSSNPTAAYGWVHAYSLELVGVWSFHSPYQLRLATSNIQPIHVGRLLVARECARPHTRSCVSRWWWTSRAPSSNNLHTAWITKTRVGEGAAHKHLHTCAP